MNRALAAGIALLTLVACMPGAAPRGGSAAAPRARTSALAVLNANGRVTVVSTAESVREHILANNEAIVPGPWRPPHRLMARVGTRVAVLSVGDRSVVLLRDEAHERRRYMLDSIYPIALTESFDRSRAYLVGTAGGRPMFTVVDTQGVHTSQAIPTRDHRDWTPMAAWQLDAERYTIAVAYHGTRTTGAEVIALGPSPAITCENDALFGANACLLGHGMLAPVQGGIVSATGTPLVSVFDRRGRMLGVVATRVSGHAMEIASWPDARSFVYIAPCTVRTGEMLALVTLPDLSSLPIWHVRPVSLDRIPRIASTAQQASTATVNGSGERVLLCGERVIALSNGSIAIVQHSASNGNGGAAAVLLVVNRSLTHVTHKYVFDEAILDLVEMDF